LIFIGALIIIYYYATKAAQSNTEYKHTKTPKTHKTHKSHTQ